jgi:Tfp pilus assembly protein PilF
MRLGGYQKLLENHKARTSVADEALKDLPEMTAEEHEMAGDTALQQGHLVMAFVQYDKALRRAPTKISLQYKKGLVFLKRGLAQDALRAFQEVLKTDDSFALAHEGIGQAFLLMGDVLEAEKHFQRAITLDTGLWKSHNALGMIYDHQKRFDQAFASYRVAITHKKDDGSLFNNLGISYYRKGDYYSANQAFEKALNTGYTEAKVYNNLGLSLARLGRYQEALLAFTKGGNQAKAYNNLGVVYLTEGKYKEALAAFEQALAVSPRYYATASDNLRMAQQALDALPSTPHVPAVSSGEREMQPVR